jgi:hypothetical protein
MRVRYDLLCLLTYACAPTSPMDAGSPEHVVNGAIVPSQRVPAAMPGEAPEGKWLNPDLPLSPEEVTLYTELIDRSLKQDSKNWMWAAYDAGSVGGLEIVRNRGTGEIDVTINAAFTVDHGVPSVVRSQINGDAVLTLCLPQITRDCHRVATGEDIGYGPRLK